MFNFKRAPRYIFGGAFFILAMFVSPVLSAETLTPFQITLMGWQNESLIHSQSSFHLEDNETVIPVKSPLLKGELEASLNLQPVPSELVVFVPGTYGGRDGTEIIRFAETLFKKGYSTLRVPNPLSTYFAQAQSSFPGLDFKSEADLYVQLVKQVQKEHRFTRLHFFGASYGALIAAIMAHDYGPDFNGRVILLSPPKNIFTSLTIIDQYFDELKDETVLVPWDHLWAMLYFKWQTLWNHPIFIEPKLAKSMLFLSGHHRGFRSVAQKLAELRATSWGEKFKIWREMFSSQQLSLRFVPFIRKINPTFFEHPERQDLTYWLKDSNNRWEIFTSSDDYINAPDVKWPNDPHLHIYENGGHMFGIMSRPGFVENIGTYLK